jgi:DNA-binding transcriptional MerR regulator
MRGGDLTFQRTGRPTVTKVRIGELADSIGLNPKTIRYYESIGLLPEPERTPSGYRDYEDADAERLVFIKTAQRLGLTLDEIAEIIAFRERGEQPCRHVRGLLHRQVAELDQRIREMCRLRDELSHLEAEAERLGEPEGTYCGLIEHIRPRARPSDAGLLEPQERAVE